MQAKELIDFEEEIASAFNNKKIKAPIHLHGNNESQLIKIFESIGPDDWIFSSWRSHYHCLLKGVPADQWFYTGMDCFIHCVESLNGTFINTFSKSYGEMAYSLCKEVFLQELSTEEKQNKLMMASWHGGMSIAYSQVGAAHALSYGLSFVLGIKHGLANCIVFNQLDEFYREEVILFRKILSTHNIILPNEICKNLSNNDLDKMIDIAMNLEPLWKNALGENWKDTIDKKSLKKIYKKM